LDGCGSGSVSLRALYGDGAVIDQDGIGRIEQAVVAAVDGEAFSADPDIGVAAGDIVPDVVGEALGLRDAGAVAVGYDDGVAADHGLDAAEEDVVVAAAGWKEKEGGEKDPAHESIVNYFILQSQEAAGRTSSIAPPPG
jgi:hypothetical protein